MSRSKLSRERHTTIEAHKSVKGIGWYPPNYNSPTMMRRMERVVRIEKGLRPKNVIEARDAILGKSFREYAEWCGKHGEPIPRPWRLTATRGMRPCCGR